MWPKASPLAMYYNILSLPESRLETCSYVQVGFLGSDPRKQQWGIGRNEIGYERKDVIKLTTALGNWDAILLHP